jgi:Ca2+-binding RTX toxin-like protein
MTVTSIILDWRPFLGPGPFGHLFMYDTNSDSTYTDEGLDAAASNYPEVLNGFGNLEGAEGRTTNGGTTYYFQELEGSNVYSTIDGRFIGISDRPTNITAYLPSGTNLDTVWTNMVAFANSLVGSGGGDGFTYLLHPVADFFTQHANGTEITSNTLISTLMATLGLNVHRFEAHAPSGGFPGDTTILSDASYDFSLYDGVSVQTQVGFGDSTFVNVNGGNHIFNGGYGGSNSLVAYNPAANSDSSIIFLTASSPMCATADTVSNLDVAFSTDGSGNTCFHVQETVGDTSYNDTTLYSMATIIASSFATDSSGNPTNVLDMSNETQAVTFHVLASYNYEYANIQTNYNIPTVADVVTVSTADGSMALTTANFGDFIGPSGFQNDVIISNLAAALGCTFSGGTNNIYDFGGVLSPMDYNNVGDPEDDAWLLSVGSSSANDILNNVGTIIGAHGNDLFNIDNVYGVTYQGGVGGISTVDYCQAAVPIAVAPFGVNDFYVAVSNTPFFSSPTDTLINVHNINLPSNSQVLLTDSAPLGESAIFTSIDGTATVTAFSPNLFGMIMDLNTDRLYNSSGTGYYQFNNFQNFTTVDSYQQADGMSYPGAQEIIPNFSINGSFGNDFSAAPSGVSGVFTITFGYSTYSATVTLSNGNTDYLAGIDDLSINHPLVGTNNGDTFDITGPGQGNVLFLAPGTGTNTLVLNDTDVDLIYRGGTDTISSTYTTTIDNVVVNNALILAPVLVDYSGIPQGFSMAAGISVSQVQVSISDVQAIDPTNPNEAVSYNAVVTVTGLGSLTFNNIVEGGGAPAFVISFANGDSITVEGNQITDNTFGGILTTLSTYWGGDQTLTAPAPGETMYATGVGNDTLIGDGNATLYAGSGNDVLSGGSGNNLLYGGFGSDTFVITTGATDQIYFYNFAQGDVIQFSDPGVVLNNLGSFISTSGTDLEIYTRVGVVDLVNFYQSAPLFMPTSGSSAPVYEVDAIIGGSNTILAFDGSGDFLGTINSAGALVPITQSPGSAFGPGYTQTASPGNENLSDAMPGGIFIADTNNDVFQGVGGDTFTFTNGNGQSVVTDTGNNNLITFDSTVTDSSVHFSSVGADLVINYGTGTGTVTVDGFFGSTIAAPAQIDNVAFADGTVDSAYYINVLLNGIIGSPGTGTVTGLTGGNDLIWGNAGNHTLVGFGNDTFFFRNGDGISTIEESGASTTSNAIQFDVNVDPSSVVFSHSGNNLEINYGTGDNQVTVDNFYSNSDPLINQITYAANNTMQDVQFYQSGGVTLQGGSTGDYFVIFSNGVDDAETINAGTGPNTYDFSGTSNFEGFFFIQGGSGAAGEILLPTTGVQQEIEIASFASGTESFSHITADTTGGVIYFTNANVQNVVLGNDPTDLVMDNAVSGLTVTGGNVPLALGQVIFDGSGAGGAVHFVGGNADNIMYGSGFSGDILDGGTGYGVMNGAGGGTDFIAGTGGNGTYVMNGGGGGDVFEFSPGSSLISLGGDTITEVANAGTETIALHGVTTSAVTMWDDTSGNLMIQFSPTDMVTVAGGSFNTTTGFSVGNIDQITFDNGSSINLDGGLTLTASQNNQQIWGTGLDDILIALGNADVLTEFTGFNTFVAGPNSTLIGGNGTDVFQIAQGLGAVTVSNAGGGSGDQIQFGAGFSEHNLVETVSGANLVLTFTGDATDSVTLIDQASAAHQISSLLFSDGAFAQLSPAGQPQPPVVEPGNFTVNENTILTGNVITNNGNPDFDLNGLPLSVQSESITTIGGGALVVNADGSFTYTPATGFTGSDGFTYTLQDTSGASSVGTVVINVNAPSSGSPPVTEPGNFSGNENSTITGNVITNNGNPDTDPNGLALSVVAGTITTAHGGSVVQNADGSFTYTPATGFYGTDSYSYTLQDTAGLTATGNVTLAVAPTPPVAEPGNYTVTENSTVSGNVITNNGNPDTDPNGLALSVVPETVSTAHGSVTVAANGDFTYTPNTGYYGSDSFGYTLEDSANALAVGMANLTVSALPPVAQPGNYTVAENAVLTGNVITNNGNPDTDPNGLALSVQSATLTTAHGGSVVLNADGSFSYTPATGYYGADSFQYTLQNSAGAMAIGNVAIGISPTPPVAETGSYSVTENSMVSGNVITNNGNPDTDPNGLTLSVAAGTFSTAHGSVTVASDGDFTYTPNTGYYGSDSFDYTLQDTAGAQSTGLVNIGVNILPPVAQPGSFSAGSTPTVSGNVITNNGNPDTDPNGLPLSVVAGTYATANGGQVVLSANGDFTYTALHGFIGEDSFSYELEDTGGGVTTGAVDISNVFGDTPPTAENDAFNVTFTGTGETVSGNLMANNGNGAAVDIYGDALHVVSASATTAEGFAVTFSANGNFSVAVPNWFVGTDSFSYTISDPYGLTSTATATIDVAAPANSIVNNAAGATLTATAAGQYLFGLGGGDTFHDFGSGGAVTMAGGLGSNIYYVNNSADVIDQEPGGTGTVISSVSYALPSGIETIDLTGSANLTVAGNGLNDVITTNTGVDTINTGSGNDTINVNNPGDVINNSSTTNSITVDSDVSFNLPANVNTLNLTGSANLSATANSGNDTITTNSGVDSITAGAGNDTVNVNNSSDTITAASGAHVTVYADVNYTLPNNVETLFLTGNSSLTAHGNSTNGDVITANNAGDNLYTGNGNATLIGGTGNDTMHGGLGNTVFDAGSGTVSMSGGAGTNTFNAGSGTDTMSGGAGANVFNGGSGTETMSGGAGSNTFNAGSGADTMSGGNGPNVYNAGSGTDTMSGGNGTNEFNVAGGDNVISFGHGANTVVFQNATAFTGSVEITNYSASGNVLDISNIIQADDPTQAAINNFVEFTQSGANEILKINAAGTGSAWAEIAQLDHTSGLDVNTMIAEGQLKVHS